MAIDHTLLDCHGPNLKLAPVTPILVDDDELVGEHDEHHSQPHK